MGIGLTISCVAVWLLLSGYFDNPLLLVLGALSCALVVWFSHRMKLFDDDDPSPALMLRFLLYLPWIIKEIAVANVDVTRRILSPALPIGPRLFKVRADQRSDLVKVIFANSITLTPGTVSVRVDDDEILVHALSREGADALAAGAMNRRVAALETRR